MSIVLPNFIFGPIAILLGVLVIIFRVPLRNWTVDFERTMYGRKVGDAMGKFQTPFWLVFVGVCIIGMGVLNDRRYGCGATVR